MSVIRALLPYLLSVSTEFCYIDQTRCKLRRKSLVTIKMILFS